MTNPYLKPTAVRAALRSLNLQPTRGMGQHFLIDREALHQIVAAAELSHGDLVVEVGPGLGVLTWELLQLVDQVIAVELDKRLAARLRQEFAPGQPYSARLQIVQSDILRLSPRELLQPPDAEAAPPAYKVVANLPYAITSPVLRHFLEHLPRPQLMVVLVQWEVAQRITAAAGDLSMLAHAIQMYAVPELVERIPASSFVPAPAVDSAILRLRIRAAPAVDVPDMNDFFRLLKAGFLQPRKKLSNALTKGLAALGEQSNRGEIEAALKLAGVAAERRAETVSLPEWAAIYRALRGPSAQP